MLIVKNDGDVSDLNEDQLAMLKKVFCHFSPRLEDAVYLFETVHGFIASFEVKKELLPAFQEDSAGRFDSDELMLLNDISKECRHFSIGVLSIKIGF